MPEVAKFNQNHDPHSGEFSSGVGTDGGVSANPAHVATQGNYVKEAASSWGMDQAKVEANAQDAVNNAVKNSRVNIMMPTNAWEDVHSGQPYQNAFQRGSKNPWDVGAERDRRVASEENTLGIPTGTGGDKRPVYGVLVNGDKVPQGLSDFGGVRVQLKSGVNDRSTWTDGDTAIDGVNSTLIPSKVSAPSINSIHWSDADTWGFKMGAQKGSSQYIQDHLNGQIDAGWSPIGKYMEAQVYGGVKLDDVDKVFDQNGKVIYDSAVTKYNHAHDNEGRFAVSGISGGPTGVATIAPGATSAHTGDVTVTGDADPGVSDEARARGIQQTTDAIATIQKAGVEFPTKNVSVIVHHRGKTTFGSRNATSNVNNADGWYNPNQPGVLNLQDDLTNQNARGTAVHELGHMIDSEAFGTRGPASLHPEQLGGVSLIPVMNSIHASHSYQNIQLANKAGRLQPGIHGYLSSNPELFARAFSQYVGVKSGDKTLQASIVDDMNKTQGLTQWTGGDFIPVGKAFSGLFGSTVQKYNHNHGKGGKFSGGADSGLADLHFDPNGKAATHDGMNAGGDNGALSNAKVLDPKEAASDTDVAQAGLANVLDMGKLGDVKVVTGHVDNTGIQAWYDPKSPGKLNLNDVGGNAIGNDGKPAPRTAASDMTHEYGHLLDFEHLNVGGPVLKGGHPGSEMFDPNVAVGNGKRGEAMLNLSHAMMKSQGIRSIFEMGNRGNLTEDNMTYFLSPQEAFARAFSQYVAVENRHSKGIASQLYPELDTVRKAGFIGQWGDKDFEPVGKAMAGVLDAYGISKSSIKKYNQNHDNKGEFSSGAGAGVTSDITDVVAGNPNGEIVRAGTQFDADHITGTFSGALTKAGVPIEPTHIHYVNTGQMAEKMGGGFDKSGHYGTSTVGFYKPSEPSKITVNIDSPDAAFFTAHEYGHQLDFQMYGNGKAGSSTSSKLSGVMDAIKGSEPYKTWKYQPDGQYWGSNVETFGRAFAQYVATKSGNPSMLRSLAKQSRVQWTPEQFKPISAQLDQVFGNSIQKYNHSHDAKGRFSSTGGDAYTVTPKVAAKLREPDGGFTFDMHTGKEATKGYALSIHPEASESIKGVHRMTDVQLQNAVMAYAGRHSDLLAKKGNMLGGWNDPTDGTVFMDVSHVVGTPAEAHKLSLEHDQRAYFDMGSGKSIEVNAKATSGGVVTGA